MQSSDEWAENYHENIGTIMSEFNSFDDLTFDHVPTTSISSPKVEPGSIPKGTIAKPIRRRSRASKRAPTTLLNANTSNFRALVQQFTGCHSSPPPFGAHKGPINLNFAQYKNYCSGKPKDQQQKQQEARIQHQGSDQRIFSSFGNCTNNIGAVTPTTSTCTTTITSTIPCTDDHELFVSTVNYNPRSDSPLTLDDFEMEDNFNNSLQELSGSNGDYSALSGNDDFWGY